MKQKKHTHTKYILLARGFNFNEMKSYSPSTRPAIKDDVFKELALRPILS